MISKIIILVGFFFCCFLVQSQQSLQLKKGIDFVWHADYDSAEIVLSEIVQRAEQYTFEEVSTACMYLGRAKQLHSDFGSAVVLYHKALENFQSINDYNSIAECELWLAEYYRVLSNFNDGQKYLDDVKKIITRRKVKDFTRGLYYSRLAAYSQEVDHDPDRIDVLKYSAIANEIALKIDNLDLEATTVNEIGFAYENMGDPRSVENYLKAYDLWIEAGNLHYAAQALVNIVRVYIKKADFKQAVYYADLGFEVAEKNDYRELVVHFAAQIMQGEERLGNLKRALEFAHIYHNNWEGEVYKKMSKSILEVEKKYDVQREKEQTNIQKNKAELADLRAKRNKVQRNYSIVISILLVLFLLTVLYFSNNLRKKNVDLKISLDQKQVLLKEVYHRVKNNLTFLSGLLFLRAKSIQDEAVKEMLLECQSRVHSMAIVHQQLYQLNEESNIDLHLFCQNLFSELDVFGSRDNHDINFEVKGNIREINLNNSIFIGLIINELALNSIKHAVNLKTLRIGIDLQPSPSHFDIKFFDNGIGLSNELSEFQEGGFGFQMIRILTKQLNATITYYNQDNLNYFHLQIPISQ